MGDRLHPVDAELAVLGSCINKNDNLDKLTLLEAGDFSIPRHQTVFRALRALRGAGSPIDEVTLESYLQGQPSWDLGSNEMEGVGGPSFIIALGLRCPDSDNFHAYADIIREAATLRRLRSFGADLHDSVARGADLDALRGMLESQLDLLGTSLSGPPRTLANVSLDAFSPGLPSGVGIERFVPGGIPRDKVTVIFGEQGNYKTTVKNAVLFSLAKAGHTCLDVSLEDSSSLTVARYAAQVHGVPYGRIASGEEKVPEFAAEDKVVLGRIIDGSQASPKMSDIVSLAKTSDVSAVFVDYVQLLDGCSEDHTELANSMRLAQLSAARDRIAYILVSQVKQDVHARAISRDKQGRPLGSPRPTIRDCFGSAAISTSAKLGLGVFRPWAYCPAPTSEVGPFGEYCQWLNNHLNLEKACQDYENMLELIVDKNVLGESPKIVRLLVDRPTGKLDVYKGFD